MHESTVLLKLHVFRIWSLKAILKSWKTVSILNFEDIQEVFLEHSGVWRHFESLREFSFVEFSSSTVSMGVAKEFSISREFRSFLDTFAQTVSKVVRVWLTRKVCVRIYFCRRRTDGPETEWSFQGKYPKSRDPVDDQPVILKPNGNHQDNPLHNLEQSGNPQSNHLRDSTRIWTRKYTFPA